MIKIDKDIPVPPDLLKRKGQPWKYPFRDMEIGDSFEVDNVLSARQQMYQFHKTTKKRFTIRNPDNVNGYRCWRVA